MAKAWQLNNAFVKAGDPTHNLHQISDHTFDPDGDLEGTYKFNQIRQAYLFRRKRDFVLAVENLEKAGYCV